MIPQAVKEESISLNKIGTSFKPHKYLALLAAIRIFKSGKGETRRIHYNEEYRKAFSNLFEMFATGEDRNRPYTPFFHLRSASFWRLIAVPGKADELAATTTVGGPGMLSELVDYAELDADFYISIVKDLSEWGDDNRLALLGEILRGDRWGESTSSSAHGLKRALWMGTSTCHARTMAGP